MTTKQTHTKGPWVPVKCTKLDGESFPEYLICGEKERRGQYRGYQEGIAKVDGENQSSREANARLIAAATDLLAVLNELTDNGAAMLNIPEELRLKMRAAIRKAEGGR